MHFIWPPRAGCTSSRQSLDLNALSARLRGPRRDSWARAAGANKLRGKGKSRACSFAGHGLYACCVRRPARRYAPLRFFEPHGRQSSRRALPVARRGFKLVVIVVTGAGHMKHHEAPADVLLYDGGGDIQHILSLVPFHGVFSQAGGSEPRHRATLVSPACLPVAVGLQCARVKLLEDFRVSLFDRFLSGPTLALSSAE